jgi:lysylphosphatidylglycerol synthetase-like protein (DUF2156 family)
MTQSAENKKIIVDFKEAAEYTTKGVSIFGLASLLFGAAIQPSNLLFQLPTMLGSVFLLLFGTWLLWMAVAYLPLHFYTSKRTEKLTVLAHCVLAGIVSLSIFHMIYIIYIRFPVVLEAL